MTSAEKIEDNGQHDFPIAALGASAGGLEALETFFKHMPEDAGIAFIIVQHLAPDHESALPELLGRCTEMPVEQARNNLEVVPNRVYVIPPNATLTVKNGVLHVTAPVQDRGRRMPIDSLFSTLAEDRRDKAICVMLSGTGTDGTLGLRAIKEYGGMALAQTPESAKFDPMVRSAITTGLVDHVLPVEEMPAKVIEYAQHLTSLNGKSKALRTRIAAHMSKIHGVLLERSGHDFSQYKESTITRRLERRMKALQIETVEQYVQAIESEPEEADRLFSDLLIGVTEFFRNPEAFATLEREVIPKLFANKGPTDQVRVGVVGCASGEEAYSLAMLLCEYSDKLENGPKIQIFATDIDEQSLETARKGRYPQSIAEHVSRERLERFFIQQGSIWQVKWQLREVIIFSNHSFIKDPPFSRLDLIACRNVMIYLGPELQQKVLPLFHYALRSGGYLVLGPSENVTSHRELFETVDKKQRIFRRKESVPSPAITFPLGDVSRLQLSGGKLAPAAERNLPRQLERIILERYGPACVIVKENGEGVYFSDRSSLYLRQPAGGPEANVLNMARDGLRISLRTTLHRAVTAGKRVVQKQISVQTNSGVGLVNLAIEPLNAFQANLYLIVFEEEAPASGTSQGESATPNLSAEEAIRHLENELRSAQDNAQAMFEELESLNEELKSSNEEFQSTNEELESSKEELQSFNEELQTVNAEVGRKVTELDHANSDLQNLLDSTQIATIFLDAELRIKNFTPAAGDVFRLIPGDIGRPITDLAARFPEAGLVDDIREVLSSLVSRERQLAATERRHFQMRIMPYRTVQNAIDGVVLTFTDVTQIEQAQQALRNLNEDLKHFAYAASHDLQEPLRMVTAYTQLLGKQYKGKLDSQADQFIGYAVAGAERMETLLKGLRDYWSVNEQNVDHDVSVDGNHLVERALADLASRIQESGAIVTHDFLPTVIGEEVALGMLFQNLIGNAIKYRREGETPRIHVSAQRNDGQWRFSVRDNGLGIEAQFLEAIFAPFKRLHGTEYSGTGIGLTISQRIVERYGGRIWVESTYGEGSVFYFTLPARKDVA